MDSLLSISSTKRIFEANGEDAPIKISGIQEVKQAKSLQPAISFFNNANEVLEALKGKPSFETLHSALKWLSRHDGEFNIKIPGPISTQIIGILVEDVLPSYWSILREKDHEKDKRLFLASLMSLTGLGALLARLKLLNGKNTTPAQDTGLIRDVLEVLDQVLTGREVLAKLWSDIRRYVKNAMQQQLLWKELISFLASGKLISVAAEAVISLDGNDDNITWLGEGQRFSGWLGENIRCLAASHTNNTVEVYPASASMLTRALSLGQNGILIETTFYSLLNGTNVITQKAETELFNHLRSNDQIKVLSTILSCLNKRFTQTSKMQSRSLISAISALVKLLCNDKIYLQDWLIDWLACTYGGSVEVELGIRRAVITALSSSPGYTTEAVKRLLSQFGDKLHIKQTPLLVQEVYTQNLLILVGRLYREGKDLIGVITKSSIFTNAISNRLSAAAERARFLGMVVGMAISELVDDPDKRMKFSNDVINSDDMNWYLELTGVQDSIGKLEDFQVVNTTKELNQTITMSSRPPPGSLRKRKTSPKPASSKIISIQEVSDSDSDSIPRFEKPDSDASDSDDDPTLINRNKPTPPVYIRDLIVYLRDTENYDRHVLAMEHAPSLIRRKSNYGSEVKEHISELASLLCGLKDEFDLESWQRQRMAAMIAIILAQPTTMGPWFANMIFSGDYSMSQRASMLTAVTFAARELAGYSTEDSDLTLAPNNPKEVLFPSKQLPAKYARLYAQATSPLDSAVQKLYSTMLAPLAASAADSSLAATGPPAAAAVASILKTRTFSSRLAVEAKRKPITNTLSTTLSESFFYPLTNRWRIYTQTHAHSQANVFKTPYLHAHLLKTITLLLSASGTSTISLPQLTHEFWSILLSTSTRAAAIEALPVLEAVLFGLLTLLDLNGAGIEGEDYRKRRLAEDFGDLLIETRAWVGDVVLESFASVSARGRDIRNGGSSTNNDGSKPGGQEDKIGLLAAGVLFRIEQVVERYQRLLMGVLAGSGA